MSDYFTKVDTTTFFFLVGSRFEICKYKWHMLVIKFNATWYFMRMNFIFFWLNYSGKENKIVETRIVSTQMYIMQKKLLIIMSVVFCILSLTTYVHTRELGSRLDCIVFTLVHKNTIRIQFPVLSSTVNFHNNYFLEIPPECLVL